MFSTNIKVAALYILYCEILGIRILCFECRWVHELLSEDASLNDPTCDVLENVPETACIHQNPKVYN